MAAIKKLDNNLFKITAATKYKGNRSIADHTEKQVIRQFASIDCLLIDEVGYSTLDKNKAGLFFELMKQRHSKKCTILTSQLGFEEWGSFINDKHITAALLDRITENYTVFNMSKCISIRTKKIAYAAEKTKLNSSIQVLKSR